ncbi:MAG: hypothetical protein GEU94_06800 [Micromonosporaceae bacterium]|nr:hypothetical protein [Micromonosporaceae bacterium]
MAASPWPARLAVIASVAVLAGVSLAIGGGGGQSSASLALHGDGLSDAHDGFRLAPVTLPDARGRSVPAAFRIVDQKGRPQAEYEDRRSRRMHVYVVRDDTHAYQHLHPKLDGDTWRVAVSVPDGGQYRLFAEFVPVGGRDAAHPILLGVPFTVAGDTEFAPIPAPAASAKVDGLTVVRPEGTAKPVRGKRVTLRFRVSGRSGALKPHHGAYAHLTAFNAMTLAIVDARPVEASESALNQRELVFRARFAERGEHRLFVEFRTGGTRHVAAFTIFVT